VSVRLEINFMPGEGAVLRMLGLVERRGFRVHGIAMTEVANRGSLAVDVEPLDSGRHLDVIARQLARLVDVQSVAVSPSHSGTSA
jgi:acetolactate synthase II small subunit